MVHPAHSAYCPWCILPMADTPMVHTAHGSNCPLCILPFVHCAYDAYCPWCILYIVHTARILRLSAGIQLLTAAIQRLSVGIQLLTVGEGQLRVRCDEYVAGRIIIKVERFDGAIIPAVISVSGLCADMWRREIYHRVPFCWWLHHNHAFHSHFYMNYCYNLNVSFHLPK